MRVVVLNEIPEDPNLRRAWNGLVLCMERPEVFFTYEWALATSRAFRDTLRPLLFLIYDSDQLRGVASFAVNPHKPHDVSFLAGTNADYCEIVTAPFERSAVFVSLFKEIKQREFRTLALANFPSGTPSFDELMKAARLCGFHCAWRPAYECAAIEFRDQAQRRALVEDLERKGRRRIKKLRQIGAVEVAHSFDRPMSSVIDEVIEAQVARFLASGRISPLVHAERRNFLHVLAELLTQSGWLKLSALQVGGKRVAWNYGFAYEDSWFWYLPTFSVQHQSLSPGTCLLHKLVDEASSDTSVQRLDLGLGDESYKVHFSNAAQRTCYMQLSLSARRHIAHKRSNLVNGIAQSYPVAGERLRGVRDRFRTLAGAVQKSGLKKMASRAAEKIREFVASDEEILFFEPHACDETVGSRHELVPLTTEHLAQSAMVNADDPETLAYLMRSAMRLGRTEYSGFVLHDRSGKGVHFLWVAPYANFYMSEIGHTIQSSAADELMIFDCWTPVLERGKGFYSTAIRMLADTLLKQGRSVRIFAAARNLPSVRGIVNAGFEYRFSLVRKRRLGRESVEHVIGKQPDYAAAICAARPI